MIVVNFEHVSLMFFVFSGFFLVIRVFPLVLKNKNQSAKFFMKALISRFIRLTPLAAFLLMFESTWFYRFGSGLLWKKINYSERIVCRKNWWLNMLLVNNYFNNEEYVRLKHFPNNRCTESFFFIFSVSNSKLVYCCRLSTVFVWSSDPDYYC